MTRDSSATIFIRDTRFPTQQRDEKPSQVAARDTPSPVGEQKLDHFARFPIQSLWLFLRSHLLPFTDAFAYERMDWFGVGCAGFVHRNIEKAGCIFREDFPCL